MTSYAVFAKRDCPTCQLVVPVLQALSADGAALKVYSQDDPTFPDAFPGVVDDRELAESFRHGVEIVPTLIRFENGVEAARTEGWDANDWRRITGIADLGAGLPALRPGCGSKSVEPGVAEYLQVRFGDTGFQSRKIDFGDYDDPIEMCFERGWSDGLPVVPPTDVRVLRMLQGTTRKPSEIVGLIPPNLAECTVEKVAINAVMAGCKPEYMPVVLAALEAALVPEFTLHGLLATTYFSSPIIIVNGPVAKRIGMNSGLNALGQGNRANATIGRALQLIVRNVGGGRPGEADRATLGGPGKYTFCLAENEAQSPWPALHVERGLTKEQSAVTVIGAEGIIAIVDSVSTEPEHLIRTYANSMLFAGSVGTSGLVGAGEPLLLMPPDHAELFNRAGWSKRDVKAALHLEAALPLDRLSPAVAERIAAARTAANQDSTAPIRIARDAVDILIVVAGGSGVKAAYIPTWSGSRAVTRAI